jgi:hypothetical protein
MRDHTYFESYSPTGGAHAQITHHETSPRTERGRPLGQESFALPLHQNLRIGSLGTLVHHVSILPGNQTTCLSPAKGTDRHTSGSTGIPKPLIWSHETAQRHSKYIALDPPLGFDTLERRFQGKRILNTFPPFHVSTTRAGYFQS